VDNYRAFHAPLKVHLQGYQFFIQLPETHEGPHFILWISQKR